MANFCYMPITDSISQLIDGLADIMQNVEPMMMGSPSSPMSPGALSPIAHNQSAFLPAYLMGDPSPMTSPATRLWNQSGMGSPPKASASKSVLLSPNTQQNLSAFSPARPEHPRTRDLMGGRGKDKSGAPPVTGLLQNAPSPAAATDRLGFDSRNTSQYHSFSGTPSQLANASVGDLHLSTIYSPAGPNTSLIFNQSKQTSPSPAQIDPFYTQGESIKPDDELDEHWITVFGFPSAATSFILQQFSQYGNILKHVVATDGNWLHIKYQSRLQAKKALSKNGKVFGSSIMVGVGPCIDKNVMEGDKENMNASYVSTPTQPIATCGSAQHTPIRPLTAAYKAASTDHDVVHKSNTPQKNNNIISKAMEYMFGW